MVGGRDNLEPTLRFLLEQKKVPGEVMDLLADSGFYTIPAFSAIEDTRAGVRAASKEYFGLDPLVDPANLRVQAAVVEAWETATSRIKALRDEEASARANKLPRQLPQGEPVVRDVALPDLVQGERHLLPRHAVPPLRPAGGPSAPSGPGGRRRPPPSRSRWAQTRLKRFIGIASMRLRI